jgi:hypothetical protein
MAKKVLKNVTTFSIITPSDLKWISNENLGNSRSVFDFRKFIKIVRNELIIQEFAWR